MIRYFFFSLILVCIYGLLLENSLGKLYRFHLWHLDFKADSQRRVFKILDNLSNATSPSIIAFGGSATREFFLPDNKMSTALGQPFINAAVSSESPYDTLKLLEIIPEHSTILFGLHPKTFYDYHFNENQIIKGYYLGGAYYKFPVSPYSNDFVLSILRKSNLPKIQTFFPMFNTYVYLYKEFSKNHDIFNILKGEIWTNRPIKQYYYNKPPLPYQALENKLDNYFRTGKNRMQDSLVLNFKLLSLIIQKAQEKKSKIVIFELPFSPIIKNRFKAFLPFYEKELHQLLRQYPKTIFLTTNRIDGISQTLFYDTIHLRPEGRKFFFHHFIKSLKKAIYAN